MPGKKNEMLSWRILRPGGGGGITRISTTGQRSAEGNDAFLWSLADLMTLLLIFFIMLYSNAIEHGPTAVKHPEEKLAGAQAVTVDDFGVFTEGASEMPILHTEGVNVQAAQPDPPQVQAPAPEVSPSDEALNRQMVAELEDSFSKDFYVRWDERQPIIVLGERITFNRGKAMLLADAHGALKRVAELISRLGDCRVVVSGHTDDLPIRTHTFPSNWELSAARAASVAKLLIANGISPRQLTIQGQSEFKPLFANTTGKNRKANRRVEISLITGSQKQGLR